MKVTITRQDALEIAQEAYEDDNYDITNYTGYYVIAASEDVEDYNDIAIAINKDEDGKYAIYISPMYEDDGCEWAFTNTLDVDELADKIMEIAYSYEEE